MLAAPLWDCLITPRNRPPANLKNSEGMQRGSDRAPKGRQECEGTPPNDRPW
jgi:hypothetical protein